MARSSEGDFTLGFEGHAWHTHGDLLAVGTSESPEDAANRFADELIAGEHMIAVEREAGVIQRIWITDDPGAELRYCPPERTVDFRLWDGTTVQVAVGR